MNRSWQSSNHQDFILASYIFVNNHPLIGMVRYQLPKLELPIQQPLIPSLQRHLRRKVESTSYHWIWILRGLGRRGGYMAFWGSEVLFPPIKISEVFLIRDASSELWLDFISPFLRGSCCSRVLKHILNMMFLGCGYSATPLDDHVHSLRSQPASLTLLTTARKQLQSNMGIKDDWWLLPKKPLQKFYTLHSKPPQKKTHPKNSPQKQKNLKVFFGWSLPEKHPHIHFKPEKKPETLGINLTNPKNQPYQPANHPYQPWETRFFGWLFCWPPVDSNPRERPRAKMLGQGPDGTKALSNKTKGGPVDLLEMEPSKFP